MNVVKSDRWLNKTDNKSIDPDCCSNPGIRNGMFGRTHSKEVKNFISHINKGRPVSEERRKCLSEQNSGSGNPNFGKHRNHSEETKQQISDSSKKMWASENHKQNMQVIHQGNKNSFFGKTHSDESKRKMSESHKRICAIKRGLK
jgi:hypothetical protein